MVFDLLVFSNYFSCKTRALQPRCLKTETLERVHCVPRGGVRGHFVTRIRADSSRHALSITTNAKQAKPRFSPLATARSRLFPPGIKKPQRKAAAFLIPGGKDYALASRSAIKASAILMRAVTRSLPISAITASTDGD